MVTVLLVPGLVFGAAHTFSAAKGAVQGNTFVVPLEITNEANLTAMDIPLRFSDGVTLKEVNFENTRVEYFDFKVAKINNEDNTVIIGLLPKMSDNNKTDLDAGSGVVANLVFVIDDPTVTEISIEAIETEAPSHSLIFVYHAFDEAGVPSTVVEYPEFNTTTIALSPGGGLIPESFGLSQNYPNPFNPTTVITYALPKATHVTIEIYNVLGQNVETLVDEEMSAGFQNIEWDGARYASGVYFYRLVTGDGDTETKKMMMLK